jgi:hypothetical protein
VPWRPQDPGSDDRRRRFEGRPHEQPFDATGHGVEEVETPGLAEPSRPENPQERGKSAEGAAKPRASQSQPDVRRVTDEQPRDQIVARLPQQRQGDDDALCRR